MAKKIVNKTLHYLRALHGGELRDLQELLQSARRKVPTVADTEQTLGDGSIFRIQHIRKKRNGGVLLHVVSYRPGDKAPTLRPSIETDQDDEGEQSAPRGKEFKEKDAFLYVCDHDVVFCSHGMTRQSATTYLCKLFEACGFEQENYRFDLHPAANQDRLALLRNHKVKSVSLEANAFDISNRRASAGELTWARNPLAVLKREMSAIFEQDDSIEAQKALSDLVVRLELRLDGNSKAEIAAQSAIEDLAESVFESDDQPADSFTIVTQRGDRLSPSSITLRRTVQVSRTNKSVSHNDVWEQLITYYSELLSRNLLEL